MTDHNGWTPQAGGLWLRNVSFDKNNIEHGMAAVKMVPDMVGTVASTHGAEFDAHSLQGNLEAIYRGDVQLDFYEAAWEICDPESERVLLGAALSWDTVGIDTVGCYRNALHVEDNAFNQSKLFRLGRIMPKGKSFPDESLMECCEHINIRNMSRKGFWFKYGEVHLDNQRIVRALRNNGGQFGTTQDSGVLEFGCLPGKLIDYLPMYPKIIRFKRNGVEDKSCFAVRWYSNQSDVRFIVKKEQGTVKGLPRVGIRTWRSGRELPQEVLECVVASTLRGIKHEVEAVRKWNEPIAGCPASMVPLMQARPDLRAAMYPETGAVIRIPTEDVPKSFDASMSETHVSVLNDGAMLEAVRSVGAATRVFGCKPTTPGVNVIRPHLA